jgi:xanthine dehydrogenase accessory factor
MGRDYLGVHSLEQHQGQPLRIFLETIVPRPTAYLFGGGHISSQLARVLPMIDFDFVVIDDREAFANQQRFPDAKACLVRPFSSAFDTLLPNPQSAYAIIVTRGHQFDFEVLQHAIAAQPKYIGMIGSRRKIQILFNQLCQQGISQETLKTIHAPIGLEIGADTPEEIAISIVAELVKERRGEQ